MMGGAAGLLHMGKAARRRQPRSGGANPETAANLHLDYSTSASINTPPRIQGYGVDVQLPLSTKLKGNSYTVSNYINS
jgi:hypothetical protein